MPRYFFHLYNDITVHDQQGQDFPDAAAAHRKAIQAAREMAAESVLEGRLVLHHRIVICDEHSSEVTTVSFGEAVNVEN